MTAEDTSSEQGIDSVEEKADAATDDTPVQQDGEGFREVFAERTGREVDPLAKWEDQMIAAQKNAAEDADQDPFESFVSNVLANRNIATRTREGYLRVFDEWQEFMASEGRHPALPNEDHVHQFALRELNEKENHPDTVKEKLRKLNNAYSHWQADHLLPHPQDYNPFVLGKEKTKFEEVTQKRMPRISLSELRETLADVTHIRDRAIIVLQLKLGLRATEVCNLQLPDVHLANEEVQSHYDQLGTHPQVTDWSNVVYIPDDREGNKSKRPRVLPIDDETRRVLMEYLLIRPEADVPWVFLSRNRHAQLRKQDINRPWKAAFHPEYAETEWERPVTSHYGRHRFTTFWSKEQDITTELVEYMRGDVVGSKSGTDRKAISEYIHTYYEDIEDLYLGRIYKLRV